MIVHVVLFQPHPGIGEADRARVLGDIQAAVQGIPSVRRFRIGRRVTHGHPGYEQMMRQPYEYAAIVEFDDLAGLQAYLAHPAHTAIGGHFTSASSATLAYDYDMADAHDASRIVTDAP